MKWSVASGSAKQVGRACETVMQAVTQECPSRCLYRGPSTRAETRPKLSSELQYNNNARLQLGSRDFAILAFELT